MKNIESAKVIFENGESYSLSTKPNSNCHFFYEFQVGNDTIQLRLDWNDLDENNLPTLDADFYNSDTGRQRKLKGKRWESHHTKALEDKGQYEWIFEECKIKFKIVLVFTAFIYETMHITDSYSAEVIKPK